MFVELDCLTEQLKPSKVIINLDIVESCHEIVAGGKTYTRIVVPNSVIDVTTKYEEVRQLLFHENWKKNVRKDY